MKITKYINAFIATAIMAAGAVSCTNDDTVDVKGAYKIEIKPEGLTEAQQADFQKVVQKVTFGEDVAENERVTYGFYSSKEYAMARYNELLASTTLDSIVNVYADENNMTDYGVCVVLKEEGNEIQKSAIHNPTVKKEQYQLLYGVRSGSLDAPEAAQLKDMTVEVYGENGQQVLSTPTYAKNHYLKTLATQLAEQITNLVPANPVVEDFGVSVSLTKNGEVQVVDVEPYCNYAKWYEIDRNNLLTEDDCIQLAELINLAVFNGATISEAGYDKRQSMDRQKAEQLFRDELTASNYSLTKTINDWAGEHGKTDFTVTMILSVTNQNVSPMEKYATIATKEYAPNVQTSEYKVVYDVAYGSLTGDNKNLVNDILQGIIDDNQGGVLGTMYQAQAVNAFSAFLNSTTGQYDPATYDPILVKDITKYLALQTRTLDFSVTFKLLDGKGNVVQKNLYKANEGWTTGEK